MQVIRWQTQHGGKTDEIWKHLAQSRSSNPMKKQILALAMEAPNDADQASMLLEESSPAVAMETSDEIQTEHPAYDIWRKDQWEVATLCRFRLQTHRFNQLESILPEGCAMLCLVAVTASERIHNRHHLGCRWMRRICG